MRRTAILLLLPIVALLFGSCSDEDKPLTTAPEATESKGAVELAAIPPGSTVESAILNVYVTEASGNEVIVRWCWDPWGEETVTWDNYQGGWVPDDIDTFVADGVGWRTADVAWIVQDWVDGTYPNNGLALQACYCEWPMSGFATRESGANRASLEVCYSDEFGVSACTTFYSEKDSYIWRAWPYTNYGDESTMLIGAIDSCAPEAVSLLWFDLLPSQTASIGDRVWYDADSNGVQDEGEAGVADVEVRLYGCDDSPLETTTTDASGYYLFDELEPDKEYYVRFILPDGHAFSPMGVGSDDAVDSDADTDGRTPCTLLEEGEADMTWDCGIYMPPQLASIGDRVWYDLDSNGIQNDGELGLEDITVRLYDCDDELVGSMTTDDDGLYLFDDLSAGDYYLEFVLPDEYEFSPQDQGGDDGLDSDANSLGRTVCTTLEEGEDDMTWDCGMYVPPLPASIGDRVWFDTDSNGVQDVGEPGLDGIIVRLYDCSDIQVAVDTTDIDGLYLFDSLVAGEYYLKFEPPSDLEISPRDQGDESLDSDADTADGTTVCTTLSPGENDMSWDCGLYVPLGPPASLGNWVWYDGDINGVQNEGEFGVADVVVRLYRCGDDVLLDTDVTDANGYYRFDNLDTTTNYYVEFVLPDGWAFTPAGATANDAKDSDADPNTGRTTCIDLLAGEEDMTWDAGIYEGPCPPSGGLGDRVWYDADHDGIQDVDEPGIGGVQVELLNCSRIPITGVFTDDNGYYFFDELPPGGYMVQFLLPSGYEFSPRFAGSDPAVDSDADPSDGMSECITLEGSEVDSTVDAGIYLPDPDPAGIGNRVWLDIDHDGVQDLGEPGVADVQVTLHQCGGGVVGSMLTDGSGLYSFTDLVPGSYRLEFALPENHMFTDRDQGYDDARDSDVDPATGFTYCTNLEPAEYDDTRDAGIYPDTCPPPIVVGDLVWHDVDQDGIQDPGEPGVSGVMVTLYDCLGSPVDTTVTDGAGWYIFSGFNHGSYQIGIEPPDGFSFSPRYQGGDGAADSDFNPSNGLTDCIYFDIGLTDLDLDAGLYAPGGTEVTIGDRVWYDADKDGIQDHAEPGMSMIQVTLYECDGYPVATTRTDNNGFYLFENVDQGEYYVGFDCPHGFEISPMGEGTDPSRDSDVDPETGNGECHWFTPGATDRGWDAGMYETFEYPNIE